MPETTPPETATTETATPAEVVVRYRYADGILLEGETFPHKDAIKQARPRWRWFRSIRKWGVPRTRERSLSTYQVEQHAEGLTRAGVPNVRIDYQEPQPEDVREFGEVLEERNERALGRAERLEQRAERLEGQAVEEWSKGRAILGQIPVGQPILVDHYSAKRHRKDLERADSAMRRSIDADNDAKDAHRRAKAAEHSVKREESPRFALRRVLELAKEARGIEVNLTGETPSGWRGLAPRGPATGEWRARLLTAAEENRQKAAHYRRVLDEAGYVPGDSGVLRVGDRVITDKFPGEVRKLLSQLVEIRFDRAVRVTLRRSARDRPDNVQRIAYDRVWVAKSVVEGRTRAPAPAKAAPAKPIESAIDLQAIATKHGFTEAGIGNGRMLHAALVDAERLGEGAAMARFFLAKKHYRAEDMQRALGRARGVVALENGTWPPRPLRGKTYGKHGFLGLLYSLQKHPAIVELHEVARAWPERMKEIAGSSYEYWFPQRAQSAIRIVSDFADSFVLKLDREAPTPALAEAARDGLLASAERKLGELRTTLDPSLYDPKSSPREVYARLCKIDSKGAQRILLEVFKLDFKDMKEALELCDGRTTIEVVAQGAEQRAEERAIDSAAEKAEREADARALLEVYRKAVDRGEVTARSFNLAYWRSHPELRGEQRKRRALTFIERNLGLEAKVRGPRDHGFSAMGLLTSAEKTQPRAKAEQRAILSLLRRLREDSGTNAETTQERDAAKPTAAIDMEAIATKHGFTDSRIGDGRMVHAALVEAERLGKGAQMARYLRQKTRRRPEDMQRALGRARGIVALETGTWPPPPLRGDDYGKQGFIGLLYSLEEHPVMVELYETARAWPGRMMVVAGSHYARWFPKLASSATRLIGNHVDGYSSKLARGAPPNVALARSARDALVASAESLLHDLREALDPSLYDPKSSPHEVYPRLCKISSEAAKDILHEIFKVDFEDMGEAHALCDGKTTLEAVAQGAGQRAEEREAESAEAKAVHKADARELLEVYSDALQRGDVTRRRFNLAYWRRHPELRPFERHRRALTVTKKSHSVEATVRGPKESWFYVRLPAKSEEPVAIEALLQELEKVADTRASRSRIVVGGGRRARRMVPFLDADKTRPKATKEPESMKDAEPTKEPTATATEPTRARSDAAPGSLWSVEEEGFALVAQPGNGTRVHVPTEHQPPLFDVGKPDPAVLERLREEELAERRAKRPPPDTSDPLLERAANDPPEPPLAPQLNEAQTPQQEAPELPQFPRTPHGPRAGDVIGVKSSANQVRAILSNRIGEDGPNGVSEFSSKHEPRMVRAAKAMAKRGEVKLLLAPRGFVRIMAGPKWKAKDESTPSPAKPAPSSSKKAEPKAPATAKKKASRAAPETAIPELHEGDVVAFKHPKSVHVTRFGTVVRHKPGQRTAEIAAADKKYHLHLYDAFIRPPRETDVGSRGVVLMKRAKQEDVVDLVLPYGREWTTFSGVARHGLMRSLPGHPTKVRLTDLGVKVLAIIEANEAQSLDYDSLGRSLATMAMKTKQGLSDNVNAPSFDYDSLGRAVLDMKMERGLSTNAIKTLEHARRVFATSSPPPMFAALDADLEAGAQELVAAGLLAPAPGTAMWGYYIDPAGAPASQSDPVVEPTEPTARLEYVDVATGVPADPSEPGTLATGRIVAEIEGETVEIDREDLAGRGTDPDPRKRRYPYDLESPADYPGQAQAKKTARKASPPPAKKGKRKAAAGLRTTFDSPAKAAALFYEHNEDFFDHVTDPWDGLRDWMDGVEARVGRGHRKLSKTPAGRKILGEKHAARAIRGALAYSMGQAKGRRWETVPWVQVDRLGEALARYFEAPSSGSSHAAIYWRPFTGEVRAEDLDAMTPDQRASIRAQESVREISEQLDELRTAYDRAKGCLPDDLRGVIERRIGEWSRWVEDPSKIPDYACEPDPKTAGYLCNYPAVAGELAQLRRSCNDAYDPNWAAKDSKQGAPGFPDTSGGEDEDEDLPQRTASAKPCCSTATPKAEVCNTPACQLAAAGKTDEPSRKSPAKTASKATRARKDAPSSPPTTAKTKTKAAAPKRPSPATAKPTPKRKPTVAERKKSLAERKKELERRRKLTAAERRAQRLTCSAAVAMRQVEAIDTVSYRRRVEDAAAAIKKADEHVKHHERDLKATMRDADAVMRARDSMPMDREIARRKVREARCQLRMAQGALRQRRRDHQRAQTELQRALTRVNKREAVAAKRQGAADKAKAEANVLRPEERRSPSSRRRPASPRS